jgi:hypothetical protein
MTRSTRKLTYRPPATQLARIAEAERHIRDITATMNQGRNRFGQYGVSCRESIKRWESTIADAREKIASGWTSIDPPEVVQVIAAREARETTARRKQTAWLSAQGHTWATARALSDAERTALQTRWTAFLASEKGTDP